MGRPKGSRNTLVRLDYDSIGALVGIRGNTARAYARRGEYDARDLESVLQWINGRRQRQRLSLLGLPDGEVVSETANDTLVDSLPPYDPWGRFLAGFPVYVPTVGGFRGLDDD